MAFTQSPRPSWEVASPLLPQVRKLRLGRWKARHGKGWGQDKSQVPDPQVSVFLRHGAAHSRQGNSPAACPAACPPKAPSGALMENSGDTWSRSWLQKLPSSLTPGRLGPHGAALDAESGHVICFVHRSVSRCDVHRGRPVGETQTQSSARADLCTGGHPSGTSQQVHPDVGASPTQTRPPSLNRRSSDPRADKCVHSEATKFWGHYVGSLWNG